ncbi:MAG: NAD(P)H-dependent oxidoreductase [Mycobacterium sp.]|nr:NAD(P)H-dependent oxidoreductase [Mycobacterium sp.]
MRTLWIEASPKGEASLSSALAEEFLAAAPAESVGFVEHFSVWSDDLPVTDGDVAIAKFAPLFGEAITSAQATKWQRIVDEIERVRAFDRLVISSPMWNWSVPHRLKAWIDVLVQPLLSFTLDQDGRHVGTLGQGRPAHLILTRSSSYDGRHPDLQDFQLPYLDYVFTMLGYTVDALVIEPTTRWTVEEREQFRQDSLCRARDRGVSLPALTEGG